MIKANALIEFSNSGLGPIVSCPACPEQAIGDSCMTHAEPGAEMYHDEDRRLCYQIPFNCENGHAFRLLIKNHKGNTVFETEFVGLWQPPFEVCVAGGCDPDDCGGVSPRCKFELRDGTK